MENYEIIVGLEVHAELNTASKMFCGCPTLFGASANTQICPVCAGLPGTLPVLNKKAVELALKASLALNCTPSEFCRFARKNYFYPDLPKNYQVSQYEEPLAVNGFLEISGRKVRIKRIHMEEDAGKLVHPENGSNASLVDFNRSCVPLIEIVTEPDMRNSMEAEEFLLSLKKILEYLEVSDCNMEEGSLRCDANISVRQKGDKRLGVKAEVKNMNSFKAVRKALDYEAERQVSMLRKGVPLRQETRLWNTSLMVTESMREKEEAHDYRYFPDPDLLPVTPEREWISRIISGIGELPAARKLRFMSNYNLSEYDATLLTSSKNTADYFEECAGMVSDYKALANWIMGDISALLKSSKKNIKDSPLTPAYLVAILGLISEKRINNTIAKQVICESFSTGRAPDEIIEEKDLSPIEDGRAIKDVIEKVVDENPRAAADYREGRKQALSFLIGQIMRKTGGKADPGRVKESLIEYLNNP